ncbi:MAG: phosphoribosylglycinamide formyltransferase [Rikenellaceae bacterium]
MKRIAIFASGNGSNFEALATACLDGRITAEVAVMICDKPSAGVIARAERLSIPTLVLSPRDYDSKAEYEALIVERLLSENVSLVCLAGYMRIVGSTLLGAFEGRIINVHPSLLPAFKGARAIEQALEYGVKLFGVTIHFVSEELDSGGIIDQVAFRYEGGDLEELETLVHGVEHPLYVSCVQRLVIADINPSSQT